MPKALFAATLFFTLIFSHSSLAQLPPIEAYGSLPVVRNAELAPDGNKLAYILSTGKNELLVEYSMLTKKSTILAKVGSIKARELSYAGDQFIILRASKTTRVWGYTGEFEHSAAFSLNRETKKIKQLLNRVRGIHPAQSGLGRITAIGHKGEAVFMPAFMGRGEHPARDLLRVDLKTGRGSKYRRGRSTTLDWLSSADGNIGVREEYSEKQREYSVKAYVDKQWREIYSEQADRPALSLLGLSADHKSVIFRDRHSGQEYGQIYRLDLDGGEISKPLLVKADSEIAAVISDRNNIVYGIRYSGNRPSYAFFDPKLEQSVNKFVQRFPGSAVYLDSWSNDWSSLLFYIEGAGSSGNYILYQPDQDSLKNMAYSRPKIKPQNVAEISLLKYKARDKLSIPAMITWPLGVEQSARKNLPTLVLPHGGPEAHDSLGFDWMAQYFASRGYLVFQPNFRGSTGFGSSFRLAGHGEWGKKMQDDISDGVLALIKQGWVDPERVCIAGWSYGGYAALAGGAFTPELYRCIIAGGPVTDLPRMLKQERSAYGHNHFVIRYWQDLTGGAKGKGDYLKSISPAYNADKFTAPVLLIHGNDDTVVKIRQSKIMAKALKKAGKDVEFIEQDNADHWLSTSKNRLQALQLMDAFLQKHLASSPDK